MVSKYTRLSLSGTIDATGALSVYSDKIVRGKIEAVHIDRPAGTVAVKIETDELVKQEIVDLSAGNTDVVLYPRVQVNEADGSALNNFDDGAESTILVDNFVVFGRLRLVCASGTATQVVKVVVVYEEY